MSLFRFILAALLMFALSGCVMIPEAYPRTSSHALTVYKHTDIGRIVEKEVARHSGKSGFDVIRYGREAFTARIAMTDLTEKTLDLQYYLWEPDDTGRLLVLHTLMAADRGVKVRVLLDDIGLQGRDSMIAAMDAHPNIEIRIFNPFSHRGLHAFDFLTDTQRVNHRMHNKTVIMDNCFALVGGRNIGNNYFGVSDEINFRDMDIAAVGPVVRDVSTMYDYFWNGKWSVPMAVLNKKTYTMKDLEKQRKILEAKVAKDQYPYPLEKDSKKFQNNLRSLLNNFVWAKGNIFYNDPKQMKRMKSEQTDTLIHRLHRRLVLLKKSISVEAAYFIPGEEGMAYLTAMRKKGIKVRILTNSLKSNDVLTAYAGYNTYRKALLQIGVELYELKDDAGGSKIINHTPVKGNVSSGLHAKIMVFDNKEVFVGSFNLDPRSSNINTEEGLYVKSSALAKKVKEYMKEGVNLENAYRLGLDAKGNITWTTLEKGKILVYTSEPKAGGWDMLKVHLFQLLPFEKQL